MPVQEALNALHPSFENPQVLWGVAAVVVAAAGADLKKRRVENQIDAAALPVADPDIAQQLHDTVKITRRRERVGYYAGAAAITFGLLHLAGPFASHQESTGSATIVIDASNASQAQDMKGDGKGILTRFDASVEGALQSVDDRDVPFAILLGASGTRNVYSTSNSERDTNAIREAVDNVMITADGTRNTEFTNGIPSYSDAIKQGLPLSGESANNVIIIAPNTGSTDEAKKIAETNKSL